VLLPLTPKPIPAAPEIAPSVRSFNTVAETLILESPVHRRDWDRDGVLPFRGDFFRLEQTEHEGRSWVYHFVRVDHEDGKERFLRLAPPPSSSLPSPAAGPDAPSFLRTMLVTAAVTLGPASDQERWSAELGVRAVWLTVLGAGSELVGGIANLQRDLGSTHQLLILLDLFLVGEGLLRLGSAFIGRPGDKPRPYGNLCRGGVYPLLIVISTLAESINGGFLQKAEPIAQSPGWVGEIVLLFADERLAVAPLLLPWTPPDSDRVLRNRPERSRQCRRPTGGYWSFPNLCRRSNR